MAEFFAFLKLEGVKGEAQEQGFEDHINLMSFSWGGANACNFDIGTGGNVGAGQVFQVSFTKQMDSASNELIKRICTGLPFPKATVKLCRGSAQDPVVYYTLDLEDVAISAYNVAAGGGSQNPMESFSLDFCVCKPNYVQQSNSGEAGGNFDFGWNKQKSCEA